MHVSLPADDSPDAVRSHLQDLVYGEFHDRWDALKRLAIYGDLIVPPLLDILQDESLDWEARWFAARGLAAFEQTDVINALLQLLAHGESEDLRQGAAEALSQIGPAAVMALSSQLHRPEQRQLAALALTRIYHPAAIAPLLQLINDPDADLRQQVIAALGSYHSPEVLPALFAALQDAAASVRVEAIKALSVRNDLDASHQLSERLRHCLDDDDNRVATAAVVALSRFPSPRTVAMLQTVIEQAPPPRELRLAAIRALGWMAIPAALDTLNSLGETDDRDVLSAAIAALGAQPAATAATATTILLGWLPRLQHQPDTEALLQDLALALGRLGDSRARCALEALADHGHEGIRLHSRAGLRQLTN